MFVLGHVAVLLLIAAAVLAASSLSRFANLEPGAEHLLGSMLGASALLLVSIHVLGGTNAVWPFKYSSVIFPCRWAPLSRFITPFWF